MRNYLGNILLYRDVRFDSGINYHKLGVAVKTLKIAINVPGKNSFPRKGRYFIDNSPFGLISILKLKRYYMAGICDCIFTVLL